MSNINASGVGFNPTHEFDLSESVSGVILHAEIRGAPASLILPNSPPYIDHRPHSETFGKMIGGKVPAGLHMGQWVAMDGWQKGNVAAAIIVEADKEGANAGLVLGVPDAAEPEYNFQAIDIDLDSGCEAHRDAFLTALQPHCGGDQMIWRETWTHRGLVLVNVAGLDIGRKHVWNVTHNGTSIGKIELLTTGQPCVVAGRHASGRWIRWHAIAAPGKQYRAPPLRDYELASYTDFAAVLGMLDTVWQALRGQGYEFALVTAGTAGNGEAPAAGDLAPPELKPEDIANAFNRMDNPADVGRDRYMNIMWGAAGAMKGIQSTRGTTDAEESMVAHAAASWAAKYPGMATEKAPAIPGDYDTELAKWQTDWRVKANYRGWRHFAADAAGLGADDLLADITNRQGQRMFTGEERPAGETIFAEPAIDYDRLTDKPAKPALHIEFAHQFFVQSSMPLIDGWIDQGELVAMIGAPGSFKTTLAADMVGSIAWGIPWMGCRTEHSSVLVVELEGARGFRHRCIAWHKHRKLDYAKAPIGMVSEGITLACGYDGEDGQRVIDAAKAVEKATGQPLRLIVVDTLSRVMGDNGPAALGALRARPGKAGIDPFDDAGSSVHVSRRRYHSTIFQP